jgi:ribonuclease P protein component
VRLLRRSDFQRVYDSGRRFGSPFFTAFALRNGGEGSRVGFTTPRALGKAVRRNRIRRRLREAVRRRLGGMGGGWDLVFNPRASVHDAPFPEVEAAVEKLFEDLRSRRA